MNPVQILSEFSFIYKVIVITFSNVGSIRVTRSVNDNKRLLNKTSSIQLSKWCCHLISLHIVEKEPKKVGIPTRYADF